MSKRHNSIEALEGRRLLSGTQFPLAIGTASDDASTSVAADRGGNIYVSGTTGGVGVVSRYAFDGTLVFTRAVWERQAVQGGDRCRGKCLPRGDVPRDGGL